MLSWIPLFFRRRRERQAARLFERFRRTFGEHTCPVCSLHRHGVYHGFVCGPVQPHASCPEAKA